MARWVTFRQDHENFHGRQILFKGERVGVIWAELKTWVVEIDPPHQARYVVNSHSETDARIEAIERVRDLFHELDAAKQRRDAAK